MAEIIELQKYRRTCENCAHWVPLEKQGTSIIRDSRCGHPGGWTPKWIGPPGPYRKMECNEFTRRDSNGKI